MTMKKLKKTEYRATLQFKLSAIFFVVMLISASVSLTIVGLICLPIMRDNSEQQLLEMSIAIDTLTEHTDFDTEEIVQVIGNSSYEVSVLKHRDPNILDNQKKLNKKGYVIKSFGIIPRAEMVKAVGDDYIYISTFSSESEYWIINLVVILTMGISVIIGTVITNFVGRTIFQPVREISRAASEVAKGNFKVRVRVPADPEYAMLAKSFNRMAEQLSGVETLRGDFISNVSHEFKTPLASIQGFAKLLQSDTISDEERREYISIIISETSRLSKLSSNILNLTKLENQKTIGAKKRFSLDEQIRSILLVLEPEWSKKDIDLDIDLEDVMYIGNEELMAQIWQNVINNAIKFTPVGGKIRVALFRSEKSIEAEIWDSGPQIDKAAIAKIFDKFYQGDKSRATEGNGLGLALVKRIIELAQGSIRVENAPSGGVSFKISLPYIIEDMM
ncbi:MAG: HAMP domain-containing histidine kinase [Ruminococcus sp.]|nr:HAMP domain-containing histidine kinase [Ruminococcus sp.]